MIEISSIQAEWKIERTPRETHEKKTNFMINVTTAWTTMTTMMSVLGSLASEIWNECHPERVSLNTSIGWGTLRVGTHR